MGQGSLYNYSIILVVALASFTYGFTSSIIGAVFGLPSFYAYFDLSPTAKSSANIIGAANGLFAGGGMIGCIIVAWLADKCGRVRAIQIISALAVVGAVIQGASVHIAMFLVGRTLGGMSAGMMNVIAPLYQSEVSPPKMRGKMVGLHGFLLVCGYAAAAWTGLGCYYEKNPDVQWRLCLCLQIVSPALLLMASPWVPESPRWLVLNDRNEKALENLKKLHRDPSDPEDLLAQEEYLQIHEQLRLESQDKRSTWQLLKQSSIRKRFLTGLFVQCLGQSTGVLVTSNYQVLLWNNLNIHGAMPLVLYGLYTSWAASLNLLSSRIIDRFGRIRLLTVGLCGCVVMLICFTAMVASFAGTTNKAGNAMGVVFLYLFVTFYASCFDATSYVYCSEIFPTSLRAQGVSASIFGLFSMTLIYTEAAATAFANVGWKYYLVFIIVPACGIPFLARLPETKGLSLEEIAAVFGDEVALDLTHMTTNEKRLLEEEIKSTPNDAHVLDAIMDQQHRRESVGNRSQVEKDATRVEEIEKVA